MPNSEPAQNDYLVLTFRGPVAQIAINRPDKRNALTQAMWNDLSGLVTEATGKATFDSADYQEGRNAIREKRAPVFHGI